MMELFFGLERYEQSIGVLTFVIAVAVVLQSMFSIRQERTAKRQFRLTQELMQKESPHVKFALDSHEHSRQGDIVLFEGFSVTNHSRFELVISSWGLQFGVEEGFESRRKVTQPTLAKEFDGSRLSDFSSPHRLRYGESVRFLFAEHDLAFSVKGKRVRPFCHDSLGNPYTFVWVDWTKVSENKISAHDFPGPGLITPEEAERRVRRPLRGRIRLKRIQRRAARRRKRYEIIE